MQAQVNLLPFIVEALGNNKKIYKDIDKLYQSNKYKFYKAAKEHELYNHQMIKEGSLIQEEYCKKVLGIILCAGDDTDTHRGLQEIIKKGFRYTWVYLENRKKIRLKDFIRDFTKKHKGATDSLGASIESHVTILIFLSMNSDVELVQDDFLNESLGLMLWRWNHYNDEERTRISISKASDDDMAKINQLKQAIYRKYGDIKNFNDMLDNHFDKKKIDMVAFMFDYENLSSVSIFEDIEFTDKDIDEILYLYVLAGYDLENIQDATKFLVSHMYIKYLIKAYKQVKDMYFENNKETMFVELEELERELQKANNLLTVTRQGLLKLEKTQENLKKENARLKADLAEEKKSREELNSLREFMFNLDMEKGFIRDEFNPEILKERKAVLVGGHEKWQQRMKELLPNFIFIHPDNMNFDIRLLDGINIVFIYVNYLNHGLYYKVMNNIAGKDIKVAYINQQNEDLVLQEIYNNFNLKF